MTSRNTPLIATLVAALAVSAVSACSSAVEGQPVAVPTTGSSSATAAAAGTSAESPYVAVTVAPPQVGTDRVQYGRLPYPGVAIGQHQANGRTKDCTLGPQVRSGARVGFLTAGHCDRTPHGQVFTFADPGAQQPVLVGVLTDTDVSTAPSPDRDVAVLWTTATDPTSTRIAGKYPIVGVMPTEQVRRLPAGTPVCVDGAWAGVRCSDLISAGELIRYQRTTEDGDSGGPVFVVDRAGRATLIGLHRGVDEVATHVGEATVLAPTLAYLNATATTA
ncbi:S1 family peptidase [Gordonia humi]|uniref:Trypsin-like peptidase domain-containing protein n=1 Tax=Gordonia humi TaxID=686429 RepID=A0A840F470_9ACTN|nr:S1 family peptidase [Gordonia humi]MBB4137248.1 hypothetical protein [Gordonia humi]